MEAKAVTSGMTAMSRRSREHRSSTNAGTIQETSALQLDIASTSKNPKVGILSASDASEHRKDLEDSPNLRRSSRFSRVSQKPSAVYLSKGLEGRANGAKVHVQGVKNISAAPSSGKSCAIVGGASEALKPRANGEAGQGVSSLVGQPHVVNSNGTSALTGSGGTPDAAGQEKGRPLRGRPRGRHVTPAKKIAKRAKRLQEVSLTESDGARILGRRIKVFWRDEDKWFYGVVKAYNRGRRTHKIVYDDKEEEWVKLHEEKFKLQVLEGEVFGAQQQVIARQCAEVTGIGSLIGKGSQVIKQEHLNGGIGATSENGGIQAPVVTGNVCAPPSLVRESERSLDSPGFCSDGNYREQSSRIRETGFIVRGVEESKDASQMVCESVDLEDPYAIDHTTISDSLVMFMRSKQSVTGSRKVAATSDVIPSSEPAAVAAKPITEVPPIVGPPLCNEAKGSVEISDVALASSDASDVFPDLVSSEGCTFEENGVAEGLSCEDGKGCVNCESLESTTGGDAIQMVSESVDLEDPYSINQTSISDSLVMFMRSKQSLAESRKVATSGVIPSSEPAAVAAKPITEASSFVGPPLCNEAKGSVEISDVALASSDASDVFPDLVSSEGCTFEENGVAEEMSCEDGKGCVNCESLESTTSVNVDSNPESGKKKLQDVLGSTAFGGLHPSVQENDERRVGEDVESGNADLSPLDVLVCVRSEEERVGLESREFDARNVTDDASKFGGRVEECSVGREVGPYSFGKHWAGSAPVKGLASKDKSVPRFSAGGSPRDMGQLQSPWLVRTERFISWYIATNLVNIDCTIPGHQLSSWIPGVDNVWRCVPYLTLFVDVILEGDRSKENPSLAPTTRHYWEHITAGISLRRSLLLGLGSRTGGSPALTCPSPSLETARVVLHGSRTSLDGCNSQSVLWQGNDSEFVEGSAESNPPCSESPCASSDSMLVEQQCESILVEQPSGPMLVEQPGAVVGRPVLEVIESGREKIHAEGDIDIGDASFPRNGEADASESFPAAPSAHRAEDDVVRDTSVAVDAGSAGGLTEVQIGSAVEGEDEGGLACYRSWKSVKRGFSQITPEDLGSNGLGTGGRLQGLLDSELGCMALTKRQKVQVESLSSRDFENGNEDVSLQECEMRGDMNTRSVDTGDCDSALPRVNVLKLRKCSTVKGGWRVAGNSCMADRAVVQSGDGGEPLTPSSIADRKRSFSECFELNQPESPEENGHPVSFMEGGHVNGHEVSNADGSDEVKVKVKGMWSNCKVASIHDVSFNPRKRFKHGSTSSGSSDDSYAPHSRAEETYPSRNPSDHVYPESVCQGCMANVLVVQHDRGWREYGATIELQSCDGQGWMLIISVRGENMYAYKAEQAMVTGSTNRHSHAIVWKGGKGWSLEFDDKKQWQIFKELHEECYRRNGKTSSARHIPIPGVRHIEDIAPRSPGCHFVRPYSRYICRTEDEVEMALGNSRVVYDMDSEDEHWLAQINTERASARGTRTRPLIAEETLERLMDKLEKDAYLYEQQHKGTELDPNDVAAESCTGLATQEVIKVIYGYWVDKRTRKGMPLVRHFQPPAWEQYQRQVKLWEQEIAGLQLQQPSASMHQLTEEVRKPPLFAFCLRPRGLEAQHKLSKQKSHRKQTWPGTAPRAWVGLSSLDGSLDRRQYYTEPGNGPPPGPRRPGRPRLTPGEVGANLAGSFNAMVKAPPVPAGATPSMEYRNSALNEYAQRRAGKGKKVGRKARRQRLLAAAQESRRKRLLMRDMGSVELQQHPDLALAAARARSTAEAARARAQALYAVADAAMHKAVAAVIAADALHAAERVANAGEEERAVAGGESTVGPTFGSWRRGVPGSALGGSGIKGSVSRQGLESDGEDALLPVASWSQELGAGLGTRLLIKDAEMEGIMGTRSVHTESPLDVGFVRARGEGMVAMLTR